MSAPASTASQRPFVGPRSFEAAERQLFFGREAEVSELVSFVVANRVVLLYAPSGAGKSSLLNAGLIPALTDEEGFEVLPPARVRRVLAESASDTRAGNVFVFNALLNWLPESGTTRRGRTPLDPQTTLAAFLGGHPRGRDARGRPAPRALIFDQFEEIVLVHPERWEQRTGFFEQLADALARDPRLRVVLAFREDYLAALDPYLPDLPEPWRFRLERLRADAALAAVVGPVERAGRSFAPGVAEALVGDLQLFRHHLGGVAAVEYRGEFVEPVQLQLVCSGLWADLPPDVIEITDAHVRGFGGVDQVLIRFYRDAVRAAAEAAGVDEAELSAWIGANFITGMGTRGTIVRASNFTAGMPDKVIEVLEERRLIRREWRAGAGWYELSHDRFIGPIEAANAELLRTAASASEYGAERAANQALALAEDAWAEGRADSALEALLQAKELFDRLEDRSSGAYVLLQIGRLYVWTGRLDDARSASDAALTQYTELGDPVGQGLAQLCRAEALFGVGDTGPANEALSAAARIALGAAGHEDPQRVLLPELVGVLERVGRTDLLSKIERATATIASDLAGKARVTRAFAEVHALLGDEDAVERGYREAAALLVEAGEPAEAAEALVAIAAARETAEDYDAQAEVLSEAMALAPADHDLRRARAIAYWYAGRWDEAIADFSEVLRHEPRDDVALSGRGQALAEAGRWDLAVADLSRAIERGSTWARAYARSGMGLALSGLGRDEEALVQFEESLRQAPENAWAYFNRAVAHERAGRSREALADYRRAIEKTSPHLNPWRAEQAHARLRGA